MPLIWAAAISAGAGLAGGAMSASASKSAANKQSEAANNALGLTESQWNQTNAQMYPYRTSGVGALTKLDNLLGITPQSQISTDPRYSQVGFDPEWYLANNPDVAASPFANNPYLHYTMYGQKEGRAGAPTPAPAPTAASPQDAKSFGSLLKTFTGADLAKDPGYQFQIQQGEQGINRAASRNGMRLAPGTLLALMKFNTGLANTTFNDAFTRDMQTKQNTFNQLANVAGLGQQTTTAGGALSANNAKSMSDLITGSGNAQASGTVGAANAISNGLSNAGNNFMNYYTLNKYLNTGNTSYPKQAP